MTAPAGVRLLSPSPLSEIPASPMGSGRPPSNQMPGTPTSMGPLLSPNPGPGGPLSGEFVGHMDGGNYAPFGGFPQSGVPFRAPLNAPHNQPIYPPQFGAPFQSFPGGENMHPAYMNMGQFAPFSSGPPSPLSRGPNAYFGPGGQSGQFPPTTRQQRPMAPMQQSGGFSGVGSSKLYPPDQPMIFNPQNPNAPPIHPCGSCHKEVHDNEQAVQCESGCNFWFHRTCVGLTEHAYKMLREEIYAEWVCDRCLNTKNIPPVKLKS